MRAGRNPDRAFRQSVIPPYRTDDVGRLQLVCCARGAPRNLYAMQLQVRDYRFCLDARKADIDVVGTLASRVMSEAIINAVNKAETDYGYPSAKDLNNYDIYNG